MWDTQKDVAVNNVKQENTRTRQGAKPVLTVLLEPTTMSLDRLVVPRVLWEPTLLNPDLLHVYHVLVPLSTMELTVVNSISSWKVKDYFLNI